MNIAIAIVLRSVDEMAIADRDLDCEKKIAVAIEDQKIAEQSCLGHLTAKFTDFGWRYLFTPKLFDKNSFSRLSFEPLCFKLGHNDNSQGRYALKDIKRCVVNSDGAIAASWRRHLKKIV